MIVFYDILRFILLGLSGTVLVLGIYTFIACVGFFKVNFNTKTPKYIILMAISYNLAMISMCLESLQYLHKNITYKTPFSLIIVISGIYGLSLARKYLKTKFIYKINV